MVAVHRGRGDIAGADAWLRIIIEVERRMRDDAAP
jgi:hypothetical protein